MHIDLIDEMSNRNQTLKCKPNFEKKTFGGVLKCIVFSMIKDGVSTHESLEKKISNLVVCAQ